MLRYLLETGEKKAEESKEDELDENANNHSNVSSSSGTSGFLVEDIAEVSEPSKDDEVPGVGVEDDEASRDTESGGEEAVEEVGAVLPEPEAAEEAATTGAVDRMIGGEKREGWQQCAVLLRILFPLQYRYHHLLA